MSQQNEKELPGDVPEHCPGTESENAGKASACEGCPNQEICASSKPKGPDPDIDVIAEKLQNVKHKILILSGKGGVGKSTVTSMIARGLARDKDMNIGVLDIDLCGPSLPRVFGVEGEQIHHSGSGWSPIYVEDNLALMSAGFLLPSLDSAVIWRGPKKNGLIKQLLRDVDWDNLDYLLIDTPPGTSDEHISIVQFLGKAGIDGAVMVTTPQDVALLDVKKEINFCQKVNLRILGMVENMSGFVCPKCKIPSNILPTSGGGVEKMCNEHNFQLLGKIPLNAMIGKSCDEGKDIFEDNEDTPVTKAFDEVIKNMLSKMEK